MIQSSSAPGVLALPCCRVGPSIPLQRGSETVQLFLAWNKQQPSILIKMVPHQTTQLSQLLLASSLSFILVCQSLYLLHSPHSSLTTITRLYTAQQAITTRLPNLFPHRIYYISPASLFLHPPIQSIQSSIRPNIHRLPASSIWAHHGVPQSLDHSEPRIIIQETLCPCDFKYTEGEEKLKCIVQWMV